MRAGCGGGKGETFWLLLFFLKTFLGVHFEMIKNKKPFTGSEEDYRQGRILSFKWLVQMLWPDVQSEGQFWFLFKLEKLVTECESTNYMTKRFGNYYNVRIEPWHMPVRYDLLSLGHLLPRSSLRPVVFQLVDRVRRKAALCESVSWGQFRAKLSRFLFRCGTAVPSRTTWVSYCSPLWFVT